jgi:hypothetical protein
MNNSLEMPSVNKMLNGYVWILGFAEFFAIIVVITVNSAS